MHKMYNWAGGRDWSDGNSCEKEERLSNFRVYIGIERLKS